MSKWNSILEEQFISQLEESFWNNEGELVFVMKACNNQTEVALLVRLFLEANGFIEEGFEWKVQFKESTGYFVYDE